MRFWSAEPPRTLKAAEKSDTVVTPGSTSMALSGSASAITGSDFRAAASISWTVIPADSSKRVLARLRSASTVMPATTIASVVHHDLDVGRTSLDAHLPPVFPEADSGHRERVRARLHITEGEKAELVRKGVHRQSRVRNRVEFRQCAFDGTAVVGPDPPAELDGSAMSTSSIWARPAGEVRRRTAEASWWPVPLS